MGNLLARPGRRILRAGDGVSAQADTPAPASDTMREGLKDLIVYECTGTLEAEPVLVALTDELRRWDTEAAWRAWVEGRLLISILRTWERACRAFNLPRWRMYEQLDVRMTTDALWVLLDQTLPRDLSRYAPDGYSFQRWVVSDSVRYGYFPA